jgi:hypothetical protein
MMKTQIQGLAQQAFLSSRSALHPRLGSFRQVHWVRRNQSGMKKAL